MVNRGLSRHVRSHATKPFYSMSKYKKQSHVVWKCDYHIVWTPKYRFRVLTGLVKDLVDHDIRMLAEWKSCEVIELNV